MWSKLNVYHISYPPYTFRIIEIKYIYLTPILHTYTSRPYVYYVGNPIWSSTISLKCVRPLRRYTWHAAHYSPPAFDRPRSKPDVSDETRRRRRRSRQKKIAAEPPKYSNQLHIERLLFTSNITIARKCWQPAVGYSKPKTVIGTGARSSHGFDQQASNVLWWTLTQSSFHQRTHITDVMISYYKPSHSSAQSKAVLLTLTASVFPLTYVIHQSLMVYKYKSTILQHRSYFHSCVQKSSFSYTLRRCINTLHVDT